MDDSYEEAEATDKEKQTIAKHFIMHSPNGQVDAVIKDMKQLIGASLMTKEWETTVRAKYAKKQLVPVGSGDSQVIVANVSEKAPGKFLNPNSQKLVPVNFTDLKPGEPEESKVSDEANEKLRQATQNALNGYLHQYYVDDKGAGVVFANEGKLSVVISMKNLNLANFWSGGWRSEYELEVGAGAAELGSRVRINVHYYEDGNVQLNSDYSNKKISITVSDNVEETAKQIVDAICKNESNYHTKLEEFYTTMHHTTFKSMRRILPKTAKKMEWNSAVHLIASEMGDAKS